MTYDEALAFWYARVDFERRPAQPGDLKLDRMRALLARLGDPQDAFGVVHIARRGDRNLEQKRTMLTSSNFKINIFCPNSDRLHPIMSKLMTASTIGGFEIISWLPSWF